MYKIIAVLNIVIGILLAVYYYTPDEDRALQKELTTTYDYIVVGSGSAGAVVASRLSEDPEVNVLLLEAGGSELDDDNFRVPLFASLTLNTKADWAFKTVPQKNSHLSSNEQKSFWPRGRVLGGSSTMNYMSYVRGSKYDYNQWAKEGCTGWSYKDVLPYFLKSEDVQIPSLYDSLYHSRGGYLTISQSIITPLADLYKRATEEIGYSTVDVNGEDPIGFSYMQNTVRNGERCSSVKAFLRPVMDRPNLHISINSMATKVIIENKTAKGIEFVKDNKKRQVFAAKEVIVSAGAVNSPVLLMLSGIGPKEHLEELEIPVHADLPVGNSLEDHLVYRVKYNINLSVSISTEKIQDLLPKLEYTLTRTGLYSGLGSEGHLMDKIRHYNGSVPSYPDYQIIFFSVAQDKKRKHSGLDMNYKDSVKELFLTRATSKEFSTMCILLHPKSRGTIRLQSRDPFDPPVIDPNYLEHPDDVKVILAAIRKSQELINTKVFQNINATLSRRDFVGICDTPKFDSDEYWECLIRHYALTVHHPTSTCRMGSLSDTTTVVDPELRVIGISGLRVADASVMRNVPSGNTNAPSIMIGEKAADMIRGKDTVSRFREQIAKLNL